MKKIMNNLANLYLLEDAQTNTIVTFTTTVEALVNAFNSYASEHFRVSCRFYKLVNGQLLAVGENELPEEFLRDFEDQCNEEYGDCAYSPQLQSLVIKTMFCDMPHM